MNRTTRILLLPALLLLASCINEDLSECGVNYGLEYQVRLTTNVHTEIETELTTAAETELGQRLMQALSGFFAERANDISLNFYSLTASQSLRHHEDHYIGGASASYTIYLPAEDYRHLSVANIDGEGAVGMLSDEDASRFNMVQMPGDTVPSHTCGLFSARRDMQVTGDRDQIFHVSLYMQNCAAAFVVNPNGVDYRDMKVYITDMATGFRVNDSTYIYDDAAPIVRTHRLEATATNPLVCHYGMGFPSPEPGTAAATPAARADKPSGLWRMKVYVTLADGSVTETILYVPTPLRAGHLRILKATLLPDGSVTPANAEIGTSVELDWNNGGSYNPEL